MEIGKVMWKPFPQPKVAPEYVAQEVLQAVVDHVADLYAGEQAKDMAVQLLTDPKALEKAMAALVSDMTQP